MSQGTAVFPGEYGIIKGAIVPTMQNSTGQDIIVSCENPDGSDFSVDGLTINAYFVDIKSRDEWIASGTIVGSGSTITWSPSAGDVGTPSEYLLYFVAEDGGEIPSYGMEWAIKDVPFGTITPPESTVGIPIADLAWVQAARALNPTPATWATQTLFDVDNLLFVDATLTEKGNVYNTVAAASAAAVTGDTVWINDTQTLNLAKSGVTYYVAPSGILSGGGGIEIPDNVGDEIVFIVDGAITSTVQMAAVDKQKLRITGRGEVTLLTMLGGAYNDVHLVGCNITTLTGQVGATLGTVRHAIIGTNTTDNIVITDDSTNIINGRGRGVKLNETEQVAIAETSLTAPLVLSNGSWNFNLRTVGSTLNFQFLTSTLSGIIPFGIDATNINLGRGNVSISGIDLVSTATFPARLYIKGTGATSSTFALIIDNSNSDNLLSIADNGTIDAGGGLSTVRINLNLASSTTDDQNATALAGGWSVATHATRQGDGIWYASDYNAEREVIRVRANGSASLIGFHGVTPVAQHTVAAVATDLATAIARVNDLADLVIANGLGA